MLLIRISDIPARGLKIDTELPLEAFKARLSEGRPHSFIFAKPPQITVEVTQSGLTATVKGSITTTYTQPCSACIEEVTRTVTEPVDFLLSPRPDDESNRALEGECDDDVGLSFYDGDHFDLEPLLQEVIILSLAPTWHPPRDAKGICSHCGICPQKYSVGEEEAAKAKTTLGALIRDAQTKMRN
jgi:uncharacterized metal-binding protein YceD (DUF177 family)